MVACLLAAPVAAQEPPTWAREPDPDATGVRLIIRGDDFGTTPSSAAALERAFRSGLMTSASVIPGAPAAEAIADVLESDPGWDVGLHLAISSEWDRLRWGPQAPRDRVPSLVAPDGGLFHSYPGAPLALKYLEAPPYISPEDDEMPAPVLERRRRLTSAVPPAPEEVEIELRAQVMRARELGIRFSYLDCHMGVLCQPELQRTLVELAAELCVPIPENGWMGSQRIGFYQGDELPAAERRFVELLDSLTPGLYRLVLHPGLDEPDVRRRDEYFGPRSAAGGELEIELLESTAVREAIRRNGIELVSVADLWDYERCRLR